jgi:hypothetical protein
MSFSKNKLNAITFRRISLGICVAYILLAYGPFAGCILHTDDFTRIDDNKSLSASYFEELLFDNKSDSFYRPINHLTFALTYHFFGLNARAYGMLNLLLLMASSLLLYLIAEDILRSSTFAALLTFGWLLTFKPIMATQIWAVGRTSGLYVFFLLLALFLIRVQKRGWLAIGATAFLAALLSKESAVAGFILLPLLAPRNRRLATIGMVTTVCISYMVLRHASDAATQSNISSYYLYEIDIMFAVTRFLEYLERAAVFAVLLVPAMIIACHHDRRPIGVRRTTLRVGAAFALFGIALGPMLLIPSRSNLYAFLPSVFFVAALIYLIHGCGFWPRRTSQRKSVLMVMIVVGLISLPVIWNFGRRINRNNGLVYSWATQVIGDATPETLGIILVGDSFKNTQDSQFLRLAIPLGLHRPATIQIVKKPPAKISQDTLLYQIEDRESGLATLRRLNPQMQTRRIGD